MPGELTPVADMQMPQVPAAGAGGGGGDPVLAHGLARTDARPGPRARVQAAFRAGWLVAQLYGPLLRRHGGGSGDELPSVRELTVQQRVDLAVRELASALTVTGGTGHEAALDAVRVVDRSHGWRKRFRKAVRKLHVAVLTGLTVAGPSLGRAYGLGRSLSDTAWLPCDQASFQRLLNPYRVAVIDCWLGDLSAALGPDAVTAARGSLAAWSEWVRSPFIARRSLSWTAGLPGVQRSLRRQGAVWYCLLAGELDPASLLTVDAYFDAGDAAARRAGHLAWRVLLHFWYAVAALLAVAGGVVYVSTAYAAGTAKFWGVFVTAVGGAGVLIRGVRGAVAGLGRKAEASLWDVERDDALVAGATALPMGATAGRVRRRVMQRPFRRPAAVPAVAEAAPEEVTGQGPGDDSGPDSEPVLASDSDGHD